VPCFCAQAGDDVVVTGTVIHRWGRVSRGARCDLDLLLRANHVRMVAAQGLSGLLTEQLVADFEDFWAYYHGRGAPLRGRNAILRSICPQLHGLYLVKLVRAWEDCFVSYEGRRGGGGGPGRRSAHAHSLDHPPFLPPRHVARRRWRWF
jgi:hypothetical protein